MLPTGLAMARLMPRARPSEPCPPATLSASEIGSFVFCPEAWYLQRRGAPRSAAAEERLDAGSRDHRRIGQRTDRLRGVEHGRRWLVVAVVLLLILVVLQLSLGGPHG